MSLLKKENNSLFHGADNFNDIIDDFFGSSLLSRSPWARPNLAMGLFGNPISNNSLSTREPIRTQKYDDGSARIEFDVPGADKSDLEIHYDEKSKMITVSSKKENIDDHKNMKSVTHHSYEYKVYLGDIDPETLEAECNKGMLIVTGKSNEKKAKHKIEIK